MGFSQAKTTLLAPPQAAVAVVTQAIFTTLAFFIPNIRCFLGVRSSRTAMAGAIVVHVMDPTTQRNVSLAGVYIMGFYNVPLVLALSLQTSNTRGTTVESVVSISVAILFGKVLCGFILKSLLVYDSSCWKQNWSTVLSRGPSTALSTGNWGNALLLCDDGCHWHFRFRVGLNC